MDENIEIIAYCDHCKDPIYVHETFVCEGDCKYHYKPCFKQLDNSSLFDDEPMGPIEDEDYAPTED